VLVVGSGVLHGLLLCWSMWVVLVDVGCGAGVHETVVDLVYLVFVYHQ